MTHLSFCQERQTAGQFRCGAEPGISSTKSIRIVHNIHLIVALSQRANLCLNVDVLLTKVRGKFAGSYLLGLA